MNRRIVRRLLALTALITVLVLVQVEAEVGTGFGTGFVASADDISPPVTATDSTDPSIPIDPTEPIDPVLPTDPGSPADSSTPTESSPTDPSGPSDSGSATPVPPGNPTLVAGISTPGPLTVTIDFDDGTADQYQTGALLKARDLPGVYFVNSGRLGLTSEYMTAAQVKSLQAGGDEIGGHTIFHLHLPQQSGPEQQRQICTDRDRLLAQGLRVTDLAIPFGEYTKATLDTARSCGYDAVRTSEDGHGGVDTLPPANPYQLSALSSLGSDTTTKYITDAITKAEKQGGGLLQVVFHRVCTANPCRTSAIKIAVFTQVLDFLVAQRKAGRLRVTTLAQAVGGPVRPAVAAPPSTATLGVPNGSFEGGSSVPGTPTCWEHTAAGDNNTASWSLVRDAHSGTWAEHADASHIDGGIGLVVTQDEGSCASPANPGDRYTYSVWYKSSAPVQLVSYRRLAAGGYVPIALSTPFAASPNQWAFATVVTRPLPAGSTGISVGIALKTAGQFTFDDFALTDSGPAPASVAAAPPAPDLSTPSATPRAVPIVAAAATTHQIHHGGRAGWYALDALLLLLAAFVLALIDRRLAWIRRHV